MQQNTTEIFRDAPVPKAVLSNVIPSIISMIMVLIYNLADTFFIGQTKNALMVAAVSVATPAFLLFMAVGMLFGIGGTSFISRMLGEGQEERAKHASAFCFWTGLAVGIISMILIVIFAEPVCKAIGASPDTIEYATQYLRIVAIGIPFLIISNAFSNIIRSEGRAKTAMSGMIIGNMANVILDPVMILLLGWNVAGAAIATVIAQGISVVLCLIYIVTKAKILLPEKRHFALDRGLYADLLAQGFSMGFMSSIIYVGSIVLQPGINSLGYETIAGHTAARKLFSFSMMPLSSMAQAVNTYVAQNRGADNRERVHKGIRYAYLFCFSVTIALIICVTPFAPTLVHLISGSSDPTVLGNGARYLRVAIPFFFALGLVNCSRLALQALGEKILPLLSSFIELFGKIIFAMVFIPRYHYSAVIWCEPIIWCFMAAELVISLYRNPYMRKGKAGN